MRTSGMPFLASAWNASSVSGVSPRARAADRVGRVALDEEPRAQPAGALAPPVGYQHLEPGLGQHRLEVAQELVRLGGLQFQPGRRAVFQRVLDLGVQPAGAAQFLQQQVTELLRLLLRRPARRAAAGGAVPQRVGVDHDRRAVVGHQREREPPRVVVLVAVRRGKQFGRGLQQLQQEPHLAALADVLQVRDPLPRGPDDAALAGGGLLHLAALAQQAGQPCDVRVTVRIAAVDGLGVVLGDQDVAQQRVGERTHRALGDRRWGVRALGGADGRGRGAHQCVEPCVIRCVVQPRAPRGEHRAAALLHHRGDHALVGHQLVREAGERRPPADSVAPCGAGTGAFTVHVQVVQQREGGAGIQPDRRNLERQQGFLGLQFQARGGGVRADAVAGHGHRAARRLGEREQQRDRRVLDRRRAADAFVAAGRFAGRSDGGRERCAQFLGAGGERVPCTARPRACRCQRIGRFAPRVESVAVPVQMEDEHPCMS
jgi:hypothetical protein